MRKSCTNCTLAMLEDENLGGAALAEPEDRDRNHVSEDDTSAFVSGQLENQSQPTERERIEISDGGIPLLDNRTPCMESRIDVMPLNDNRTSSIESVMPQRPEYYEDPWPLPTCSQPNFQWGSKDGKALCDTIDEAYNDNIHWKCNIFLVSSGASITSFCRWFRNGMYCTQGKLCDANPKTKPKKQE